MVQYFNVDNSTVRTILEKQDRIYGSAPGAIKRDWQVKKYGSIEGIEPIHKASEVLIDPKDYKEKIAWAHANKIFPMYHQKATWAPGAFRWNQNGLNYCHSADTEVLTDRGWVPWPEVTDEDLLGTVNQETQKLEFQKPSERQVLDHDGDMVYSTNRRMDFAVTPNHRMYVRKFDCGTGSLSKDYDFVEAKDLGWYVGLMHAPSGFDGTECDEIEILGDRVYDADDFIRMLSLVISDGWAGGSENTKNRVSFSCFDDKFYDDVAKLAERLGFNEVPSCKGVFTRDDNGVLASWVRRYCYTGDPSALTKCIPDTVKLASERQINMFLDWYGDQNHSEPQVMYFTISPKLVDDLQELLLKVGKRSTPSWREAITQAGPQGKEINCQRLCCLCVSQTERLCLDRKKHIKTGYYKGKVYCATMPNGTLITRRNGSVLISGNCWAWSVVAAMMDCRAVEERPTVLLAPVSLGFLVNWRNAGNYLSDGVKGCQDTGVVPASHVPDEHSRRPSTFLDGWEEERKKYRLAKDGVWDCDPRNMIQHCISMLCTGTPGYIAYNWWGHALELVGVIWDETQQNNLIWIIRNSHDEYDFIELTGSRGVPDECLGIRATLTA